MGETYGSSSDVKLPDPILRCSQIKEIGRVIVGEGGRESL